MNNTIYICGGGSSLKGFRFDLLKGLNVIAINKALIYVPFAKYLFFNDYNFYKMLIPSKDRVPKDDNKLIDTFNEFKGTSYTLAKRVTDKRIIVLKNTGVDGLELDKNGLRNGNNSGYGAINLAYHLGATKIYLLGYDMKNIDNTSHFHSGYGETNTQYTYNKFMKPFDELAKILKELNIEVINCSIDSALNCFPKIDINEMPLV